VSRAPTAARRPRQQTPWEIVIIGALVGGGFFVAAQQHRIGLAGRQAGPAFYAAEAGLSAALAGWDPADMAAVEPGATSDLAAGELSSGDRYVASVTRLDAGQHDLTAYYLVTSTGLARGPRGGRRQVALLLRASVPAIAPSEVGGLCGRWLERHGGVVFPTSDLEPQLAGGGGAMDLPSCAFDGSPPSSKLYLPHPLAEFSWLEILE
jgi:hypothetical protein